jgi:Putative Actinobacterial Holin-X, holin superfamily III
MATTPYGSSPSSPVAGSSSGDRESQSAFGLLRRLTDELATLLRQELALATAEVSRSMRVMLGGAASLAVGGAVLFTGLLAMLAAAVLGLATVLQPWLAALAIGAAVAVIGIVLVVAGIRSMDPSTLKPSRTAESLRRDRDVITRR